MTKLLMINAHPHTTVPSASLTVAASFKTAYQQTHPNDEITTRDLYQDGVPALNDTTFEAWRKQKYSEELTSVEAELLSRHAAWLTEFLAAELKQYLDLTSVARKTFKYTVNGPVGLLPDKHVLHIQAAGGYYHQPDQHNQVEAGDPYLRGMMQLYGIQDYRTIFIEGLDQFPEQREQAITAAQVAAEKLAGEF